MTSLKWSWDNTTIAIGLSSGDILLHDTTSEQSHILERGHQGIVHDLMWMPDRHTLASAGNDGVIVIWDLAQREIRLHIDAHRGAVKSLAFETKSNTLVSGGQDGLIRRWPAALQSPALDNVPDDFAPPDPTAAIQEVGAEPSEAVNRNLELARWLIEKRALYSLDSFGMPMGDIDLTGFDFDCLKDSASLRVLKLFRSKLSDNQLIAIERLFPQLRIFETSSSILSDDSIAKIDSLKHLKTLCLSSTKMSDDSLPAIQGLKQLEKLDLRFVEMLSFPV